MVNDEFLKKIKQIDEKLSKAIVKLFGKKPNKEALLKFINSKDFDKLIEDLGLKDAVKEYVKGFDIYSMQTGTMNILKDSAKQSIINSNLLLIKNTYSRTILGYFSAYIENLKSKLTASILQGITAAETIRKLKEETPLSTAQIGSVVNTSYADYNRATISQIYVDKPEQRFYYEGGVIPTSSDECRWLYENQKLEGYTKKEIDAGIETPFVYEYGELKGQVKKIYWFGRFPNYNCIHTWMPIEVKNA